MRPVRPAAVVVTALVVIMATCVCSPCSAAMAAPAPFEPGLPEALVSVLLQALQALALAGPLLGLGPLVIGRARRSVDRERSSRVAVSQPAQPERALRTIVGGTPAAGIASRCLAPIVGVDVANASGDAATARALPR